MNLARERVCPLIYRKIREIIQSPNSTDYIKFEMPVNVVQADIYQQRELRRATVRILRENGYQVKQDKFPGILHIWFSEFSFK